MLTPSTVNRRTQRRERRNKIPSSLSPVQKQEVSRIARTMVIRQAEKKYITTGAFGATSAAYQITSLCDIPQGLTDSNRVGDAVRLLSMECFLSVEANLLSGLVAHYVRVKIFQFMPQFSVAPPSGTNTQLNDPIPTAVTHRSPWIVDGREMIKPLHDEIIVIGNPTSGTPSAMAKLFNVNFAPAKKEIEYLAGSTTDGWGKIFFGIISSSGTTPPNFAFTSKLVYTDI